MILSFADLKKYKFHYWFAFPAIPSQPPWVPSNTTPLESNKQPGEQALPGSQLLTGDESSRLVDAVQTWKYGVDSRQHGFFLARKDHGKSPSQQSALAEAPQRDSHTPTGGGMRSATSPFVWKISSLESYDAGFFDGARFEECYVCFADPSNYLNAPGWMLRNLLVLVRRRWRLDKVQILCYRDVQSRRDAGRSFTITLQSDSARESIPDSSQSIHDQMPKVTGWERNSSGKLAGRMADLTAYMDPHK
jgi:ubiquitin-like modifier-activating enzyme ATG7